MNKPPFKLTGFGTDSEMHWETHLWLSPAIVRKDGVLIVGTQDGANMHNGYGSHSPSISNMLMVMNSKSENQAKRVQYPMANVRL